MTFGQLERTSNGLLYTTLNTGARMPLVGFGTYSGSSTKEKLEDAIYQALKIGYRHIDTAQMYGTEVNVGRAVARAIKDGIVSREELFITTKLDNTNHAKTDVERSLRESLKELDMDYVDLFLVHWPWTPAKGPTVQPPLKETWQAMEDVANKGLAKAVGVSNWSIKKLEDLLSYARIVPAVNQVEAHPGFRNEALLKYHVSKGIHTSAWSPLGGQFETGKPPLVERDIVKEVAKRTGKTPGQVILRWGVQRVTSVLPKTATPSRVAENYALDFELSEEDFKALNSFEVQIRQADVTEESHFQGFLSPEGPYRTFAELWD